MQHQNHPKIVRRLKRAEGHLQTIIGMTLGPAIVGKISDILKPMVGDGWGIAYPMAAIGIVNLWAARHYFLAARRYREDLTQTAALNAAQG